MNTAFKSNSLRFAGIAGGSFLLGKVKPEWGQKFLYNHLKKFPGVPAKFSQWLEQKWEVNEATTLPILSVDNVREILALEVPKLLAQVEEISEQAYAASIGQVHRVKLEDGTTLAVKIQYPGLAEEVRLQIDQLVWMMEKSPARRFGFNAEAWRKDLQAMFGEELDYRGEMQRQQRFREEMAIDGVGTVPWILVPEVYPDWCTSRVLTQSYVPGLSLETLLTVPSAQRQIVANSLARVLIRMLLASPLLHGDLQPKNWAWCPQQQRIILYDFGSCVEWGSYKQRLFESLVLSIKDSRERSPFDYLVALGFDPEKLLPINQQLPAFVENLLEPFWDRRLTKLSDWHIQKLTQEILGEQSWYFRTAGPPWFLWVMRSFASVFFALRSLSDSVALGQIFLEEQKRLSSERWQGFEIPSQQAFLEKASMPHSSFAQQAQFLHIRVTDGGADVVSMRFPIQLLQRLEELMEPELLQKLREQNLDIAAIKTKAYRSGLSKQELFKLQKESRNIRVWIA